MDLSAQSYAERSKKEIEAIKNAAVHVREMISRVNNGLDSNAARGKKAQQEREVKDKGGDKGMVRFSLFLPYCDVYFYCTICDQRYSNKQQNRHPFATDRLLPRRNVPGSSLSGKGTEEKEWNLFTNLSVLLERNSEAMGS